MRDVPPSRHDAMSGPRPIPGRVSVVMPCLNAAVTLDEAIHSVLAQSYPDWELWIIDDGSTDASAALARQHASQDSRIQCLTNRHTRGVAGARNTGIEMARGEFVAFLDADDGWLPAKLARQVAAMRDADAVFSTSGYHMIDEAGRHLGSVAVQARIRRWDLLHGNTIGCLTAMYNQARIGKFFMPEGYHHEDYLTWLAILDRHGPALGIPEPLALYRRHRRSLSGNKSRAARWQWRIYREALQLPWWQSLYLFCHYAWRGLVKHRR